MQTVKLLVVLACVVLAPVLALAQTPPKAPTPSAAQLAALKQLSFLVGHWQGSGWAAVPGGKATFSDTETVTSKAGGAELDIESQGQTATGSPARQDSVIVSYDPKAKVFHLRHAQPVAGVSDATVQVTKNILAWIVKDPHHGPIRTTIQVNAKGQWTEWTELSHDGKNWQKFMALMLKRVP